MGQVQQSKQHFLKNWQRLESRDSVVFGCEIEVYTNGKDQVAVVHKVFQNEYDYQKELKRLEVYRQHGQNSEKIKLLHIAKEEESSLCSNFYKIDAIFDFNPEETIEIHTYSQKTPEPLQQRLYKPEPLPEADIQPEIHQIPKREYNQTPQQQITQQIYQPTIQPNNIRSSEQQIYFSTQGSQQQSSLQYLTLSQSPNHRYSQTSHQSSITKQQTRTNAEYGFLHEQVHIPYNPGSDFLDSSRQKETIDFVSPSRVSQRPSSKLKDISNKKQQPIKQTTLKTQQQPKKPQLLKSQRPQLRSKSPNVKRVPTKK